MPSAHFFAQLGLFVAPGFLPPDACARLRREMEAASHTPALILGDDNQNQLKRDERLTDQAQLSPPTISWVEDRFRTIQPAIEAHFGVGRTCFQPLSFLIYREGHYFVPHRDEIQGPGPRRLVSISILLNDEGPAETGTTYSGGALTFYGLLTPGAPKPLALPLIGEEGLLVGFRSDMLHGVQPITRGTRYSIVTWLI